MDIHIHASDKGLRVGVISEGVEKTVHVKSQGKIYKKKASTKYASITFREPSSGIVFSGITTSPKRLETEMSAMADFLSGMMLMKDRPAGFGMSTSMLSILNEKDTIKKRVINVV